MKRILIISMVFTMLMIFTGCVRVETHYKVNNDNSGFNALMVAYNEVVVEELGLEPQHIMDEVYNVAKGLDRIKDAHYFEGQVGYLVNNMQYVGENRLVYFDDIRTIFNPIGSGSTTVEYLETKWGVNRIELPLSNIKSKKVENSILDKLFYEAGGEIIFSIEVESPVTSHNATRIEGKKYIWDLMDIANNPDKYGNVAYIEYRSARGQQVVSRGGERQSINTREDIETLLQISRTQPDFHAKSLYKMGLLSGTDKGLELDRKVTRIEGTIFYARLLGIDKEIQTFKTMNPEYETGFTDIPEWAKDTVNYLHHMGLVSGVSEVSFGAKSEMTEAQFVTLVLRAVGLRDSEGVFEWMYADKTAKDMGFYAEDFIPYEVISRGGFTRRMMSYIGYNVLFIENKDTGVRLLDNYIR